MAGSKKTKKKKQGLFESIRKPTAPPSRLIDGEKRPEKLDPVERKVKHKKQNTKENDV